MYALFKDGNRITRKRKKHEYALIDALHADIAKIISGGTYRRFDKTIEIDNIFQGICYEIPYAPIKYTIEEVRE